MSFALFKIKIKNYLLRRKLKKHQFIIDVINEKAWPLNKEILDRINLLERNYIIQNENEYVTLEYMNSVNEKIDAMDKDIGEIKKIIEKNNSNDINNPSNIDLICDNLNVMFLDKINSIWDKYNKKLIDLEERFSFLLNRMNFLENKTSSFSMDNRMNSLEDKIKVMLNENNKRTGSILDKFIYEMCDDRRIVNSLRRANIHTFNDLIKCSKHDLKIIPNIGNLSLIIIENILRENGLKLKK